MNNLGEDLTEDTIRGKFSEFGKVGTDVIIKDGNGLVLCTLSCVGPHWCNPRVKEVVSWKGSEKS